MINGQSVVNCEYSAGQLSGGGTVQSSTSFTHGSLIANASQISSHNTAIRILLANGYLESSPNIISGSIPIFGDITTNLNFVDNLSKIQQFFGVNVYQTSTSLFLIKSDFHFLNPSRNNTAESLFVALLKQQLLNISQQDSLVNIEYYNTYFDRENKKRTMTYEVHCLTPVTIIDNEIQQSSKSLSPNEF